MNFEHIYHQPAPRERYFIDLPQECIDHFQIKGMTTVKGTINGIPFKGGLFPKGKGLFAISFTKALQSKINAVEGDVLLIDIDIAYKKTEKPVPAGRPVDPAAIKLVMQNKETTCGQACIAMLSGRTIDQVIADLHTSGPVSIGHLTWILDLYNISHGEKNTRLSKKNPDLPKLCIITVHFPSYSHWSVYNQGVFYDPEFGICDSLPADAKITSFLEIHTA